MKTGLMAALLGTALFGITVADAQAQARVRGTITGISGDVMAVKAADGKNVDIHVSDKTAIVFLQPIAMRDIKPGDFLGVTSVKRSDGTLTAYDVRRFMKPTNPGHRPFDGGDNQTMTNAAVSATVDAAKGRELSLSYEGGSQKVRVADTASITSMTPGQRSHLVPGAFVSVAMNPGGEGKPTAREVQVYKEAPKVPQ
jgi:hypothetical protein